MVGRRAGVELSRESVLTAAPTEIPFGEALRVWTRIAAQSFGGPAGQVAVMHRILVDEKRWFDEADFLHALSFCTLLPGPEAQQLATYLGWRLHGARGALAAGTLFIVPGFAAILALSIAYVTYGALAWVAALFFGLKTAVLALVLEAAIRIGRRVLAGNLQRAIAAGAFVSLCLFGVPFPAVVLAAGIVGVVGGRFWPGRFAQPPAAAAPAPGRASGLARTSGVLAVFLPLWLGPTALCASLLGEADVFTRLGVFFSRAAVVTFGGAYAVLAWVAQHAVEGQGWLSAREMLDGLGLAETTPGPLIMVVQFVGFLAAYRHAEVSSPLLAGVLGSILTAWVTFVPSFLWIFLGAPYVERLRHARSLAAALQAVMAAVVGVIANLALWFALHVVFARVDEVRLGPLALEVPDATSLDPWALALSLGACLALLRFGVGLAPVLAGSALAGLAVSFLR